ncbi:MAG TPA: hypothetical protein PKL15_20055, partial [Saprospiraceae bacterium]|nr:hypothetical protein [Saprospiraceae bacterium]
DIQIQFEVGGQPIVRKNKPELRKGIVKLSLEMLRREYGGTIEFERPRVVQLLKGDAESPFCKFEQKPQL